MSLPSWRSIRSSHLPALFLLGVFGLIVALISMLYPADYSLTWITMINIYLAWLVTLVGMWLLMEYARCGGWARARKMRRHMGRLSSSYTALVMGSYNW